MQADEPTCVRSIYLIRLGGGIIVHLHTHCPQTPYSMSGLIRKVVPATTVAWQRPDGSDVCVSVCKKGSMCMSLAVSDRLSSLYCRPLATILHRKGNIFPNR